MRTKLFGAFISALAIAAFAALPSMASAQNVTLKEGSTTVAVNETLRATSSNTIFSGRPFGPTVACAKTSIRAKVRTNPGARITFRNEGVFQNAAGGDLCKVIGPPDGRITARVENLIFRKDITLQKTNPIVEGRTEVRFTFRFFDPTLNPNGPIAACNYEGTIEVTGTVGSDVFYAESETDATLQAGSIGECAKEGTLEGDFRLTRRDGTTPVYPN